MKKRGDVFLLVGAILTIFVIIIMAIVAAVVYDYSDKEEIAKELIKGELDLISGKNFEETVDYYHAIYMVYFAALVIGIIWMVIKIIFDILAYITHNKVLYILCIVFSIIAGPLASIFTLIGAIMSLTDKSIATPEQPFIPNNINPNVTNNYNNVNTNNNDNVNTNRIESVNNVESNDYNDEISNEYGSEVKESE